MTSHIIDKQLLGEAADWVLRLREGALDASEQRAFDQWQARSAAHREAWQRAETVLQTFGKLQLFGDESAGIGRDALRSMRRVNRRRLLGLLVAAGPVAWLAWRTQPWQGWRVDIATATGERRTLDLADGSRLVINTASAVDIDFTPQHRRLRLQRGEILITTGRDPSSTPRPFLVETAHGAMRALGTRFSVRRFDDRTRVAVFEHTVGVTPVAGVERIVQAGEQLTFNAGGIDSVGPVDMSAAAWEHGMLAAKSMRLGDVAAELARYRRGVLRCDPAVAHLPVSGAISLDDTDAALRLLERNLPVRISRVTSYWVAIEPA